VEVKRRSSDAAGTPEEAVDRHKRDQIRRAAESFVRRYRAEGRMMRFDVIAISGAGRRPHLEHLRDAFGMLDIKLIRERPDFVEAELGKTGVDPAEIDRVLEA